MYDRLAVEVIKMMDSTISYHFPTVLERADRQTDTDRQTQIDTLTDRQTDRQTDKHQLPCESLHIKLLCSVTTAAAVIGLCR